MEKLSASSCSLENTLSIIAGKWKSVIIYYLLQRKVCRFSELQKLIPDCSKRMLALQLKDLKKDIELKPATKYQNNSLRFIYNESNIEKAVINKAKKLRFGELEEEINNNFTVTINKITLYYQ